MFVPHCQYFLRHTAHIGYMRFAIKDAVNILLLFHRTNIEIFRSEITSQLPYSEHSQQKCLNHSKTHSRDCKFRVFRKKAALFRIWMWHVTNEKHFQIEPTQICSKWNSGEMWQVHLVFPCILKKHVAHSWVFFKKYSTSLKRVLREAFSVGIYQIIFIDLNDISIDTGGRVLFVEPPNVDPMFRNMLKC